MARRTTVELIDDVDGGPAAETIAFSVGGKAWEIDLNAENADQFRADLEKWQSKARRATSSRTSRTTGNRSPARRDPEQTAAIRRWAQENGHQVSDRGRIPADVEKAYEEAH